MFLEVCRDKGRADPSISDLIRFNTAHESGHQFELEHADGAEVVPGSGTFLMQTSPNTVFPDSPSFSAVSLDKIRRVAFPQDE